MLQGMLVRSLPGVIPVRAGVYLICSFIPIISLTFFLYLPDLALSRSSSAAPRWQSRSFVHSPGRLVFGALRRGVPAIRVSRRMA